jgi:hypothetical protein
MTFPASVLGGNLILPLSHPFLCWKSFVVWAGLTTGACRLARRAATSWNRASSPRVKRRTRLSLINYSKKVKEHSAQQPQFLSCSQSLTFIELLVDNVNSRGFNVSLANDLFFRTLCGKNAEAAENKHIFQLLSVFDAALSLALVWCWCWFTKSCENQGCSLTFFWVVYNWYALCIIWLCLGGLFGWVDITCKSE